MISKRTGHKIKNNKKNKEKETQKKEQNAMLRKLEDVKRKKKLNYHQKLSYNYKERKKLSKRNYKVMSSIRRKTSKMLYLFTLQLSNLIQMSCFTTQMWQLCLLNRKNLNKLLLSAILL